jgi:hypothetical protein
MSFYTLLKITAFIAVVVTVFHFTPEPVKQTLGLATPSPTPRRMSAPPPSTAAWHSSLDDPLPRSAK